MKIYLRIIFIFLILITAQSNFVHSAEKFDKYLNSNWGTEFWFTVPPALIESGNFTGNYVKIYINSDHKSEVILSVPGKGFTKTATITPGYVFEFSIDPEVAQPYIKTGLDPVFPSDLYKNSGINIKSDNPITVHVTVKYNTTSEGFAVLPVNVLGKEYVVSSYADAAKYYPDKNSLPGVSGIVAPFDGTEVRFTLGGNSVTKTSSGQYPGETVKKILNKGDVWMISTAGNDADLTGSKIIAGKPVAVISGCNAANIPVDNKQAGYIVEMEIPAGLWGKTYHIPEIFSRKRSPVIRVFAKELNTKVYYNGIYQNTLLDASQSNSKNFVEYRIDYLSNFMDKSGTITSDKPINVTLYNTGVEEEGLPVPPGDPFQMSLQPVENYLDEIIFATPSINPNLGFQHNYLNLIYKKLPNGDIPSELKLGKFNGSVYNFSPVTSLNILSKKDFPGTDYGLIILKLEPSGNYSVQSESKFAAYLYGFNRESAYGFPAGMKLTTLERKDTQPPVVKWSMNCNGNVRGTVEDMPQDKSIRSNLQNTIYLSDESTNFVKGIFDPIIPGETVSAEWNLFVVNKQADAKAVILFTDAAGNYTKSEIYYKAAVTEINSHFENYGSFKSGAASSFRNFSITNKSDSAYMLTRIELKDKFVGFELTDLPQFPLTLKKNESVQFKAKFSPDKSGTIIDSVGYGDECRYFNTTHLEATVGSPVIEVSDITFGDVTVGSTNTATAKIKNTGVSELLLSGWKNTVSNEFEVKFDKEFSVTNPLILFPNEEISFTVIYKPITISKYSDSVLIFSDAASRDNVCLISARSIEPGLVATSYNWGRKRIFRSLFPAGPYPIENDNQSIVLQNTGNSDITLSGVEISADVNSEAFEFNRQQFVNLKINAGQKYEFKVSFRPIQTGLHKLTIKYLNNFGSSTVSEFEGFGTVPKIISKIIDFDTAVVENYEAPIIRKIEILNMGVDEWEFADELTIYDFFTGKNEEISEIWSVYGTTGFKIDKQPISFPLKLEPGKSYLINAGFVPKKENVSTAVIEIISDALDTALINLTGFGIDQALTFTGGTAETCVGFEKIISGTIKNNSKNDINIDTVIIKKNENEFRILNNEIIEGFTLKPGDMKNLDISYRPADVADKQIDVELVNEDNPSFNKRTTFFGRPVQFISDIVVSPTIQTVDVSDTVSTKFMFRTDKNLEGLNLTELEVLVNYNSKLLHLLESSVKIGSQLDGQFGIIIDNENSQPGSYKFIISSFLNDEIKGDIDLFKADFETYFPNALVNYSDISVSVYPVNNECVVVNNTTARVNINPVCGNNLRLINMASTKYKLDEVTPNPVSSAAVEINFAIGISAYTDLRIFGALGEEINNPVNGHLSTGEYSLQIPTATLNSGIYYIILKSGPFYETKKFVISK